MPRTGSCGARHLSGLFTASGTSLAGSSPKAVISSIAHVRKAAPARASSYKTADGTVATADGGTAPKAHDGWMWDLTVPGNNDHDFYIDTAVTSFWSTTARPPRPLGTSQPPPMSTLEGALDSRGVVTPAWDPADPAVAEAWYTVSYIYGG
jgi:hypothetical protein